MDLFVALLEIQRGNLVDVLDENYKGKTVGYLPSSLINDLHSTVLEIE